MQPYSSIAATLFHALRRKDVEAGLKPTVAESLLRLES